ncbi:MAG: DUF5666 domain-containing protein [Verrucomicrobiota bacterium]
MGFLGRKGRDGAEGATRAFFGIALLAALLVSSCWTVDLTGLGTGESTEAASGTGVGPVTGFGSVKLGGVEFADGSGTTVTDDQGRGLADLVEGMRVTVRGTIAADYLSGTADSVTIEREVRGPVDDNGVSLESNALRVLGQSVLVTPMTVMVQSGGAEFTLADLKDQLDGGWYPGLEIHGAAEDNGTIHAAYIGWEQDAVVADDNVALRGKIEGLSVVAGTFFVGDQEVDYRNLPSGGRVDWPATGLANGLFVDVRGYIDAVGGSGTVRTDRSGNRIAVLTASLGGRSDRVTVEGYVLSGGSASFMMSVPGGTATVTSGVAPTGDTFAPRKKVRVEGKVNGTSGDALQASSVTVVKTNDVLIEGAPEGVPTSGDTMTLLGKTIEVDRFTLYRDGTGAARENFGLASLSTADTVRVVGWFDDSVGRQKVVAARVERLDVPPSGTVTLQGPVVTAVTAPLITILGINVVTDDAHTDYFDRGGVPISGQSAFFLRLAALGSGTVVQVRNGVFNASSFRIDPPSTGSPMEVEIVTINN